MEGQQDPRLQKGIEEFNQQLFFECHETLEEIWLEEHGEDRRFYQGIIQIAAGYYKLEQGVPAGRSSSGAWDSKSSSLTARFILVSTSIFGGWGKSASPGIAIGARKR